MRLLVASGNAKKLQELTAIAAGLPVTVLSPASLGRELPEVEEDGTTFAENALKKARAFSEASGLACVADDSGLCVDALGGAPGIFSARYSGPGAPDRDAQNNAKLLLALRDVPAAQRGAAFHCALALVRPGAEPLVLEGRWKGRIAFSPRGAGGFGYDPLFLLPQLGRTSAELTSDEKNGRSHRAQAMRALRVVLERLAMEGRLG